MFDGILSFEFQFSDKDKTSIETLLGFQTVFNEKVFFKTPLPIHNLTLPYLINELDVKLKEQIKIIIYKCIGMLGKAPGDHKNLFKNLTGKNTTIQALILVNEILFHHEVIIY